MACLQKLTKLNIKGCLGLTRTLYSTTYITNTPKNIPLSLLTTEIKNPWIWQKQTQIQSPLVQIPSIELPKSIYHVPTQYDPISPSKSEIFEPIPEENKIEKHAVKLIVIRRHKMRKHKLKKLRKKMKFEWAKRRQRREMLKEKLFQGGLLTQIKEAEKFSAEEFVAEKIRKATEVPIPRFWKGKRLPEFIIREKLGLSK